MQPSLYGVTNPVQRGGVLRNRIRIYGQQKGRPQLTGGRPFFQLKINRLRNLLLFISHIPIQPSHCPEIPLYHGKAMLFLIPV